MRFVLFVGQTSEASLAHKGLQKLTKKKCLQTKNKNMSGRLMRARLHGATLSAITRGSCEVIDFAQWHCHPETGLQMQAIDVAHICFVKLNLPPSGFMRFECPKPLTLDLSLKALNKLVQTIGDDDIVTLEMHERRRDCLTLHVHSERNEAEFQLRLLNIDAEKFDAPESDMYSVCAHMPSQEFARIIAKLACMACNVLEIRCSQREGIVFAGRSDIGSGSVHVKQRRCAKPDEHVSVEILPTTTATTTSETLSEEEEDDAETPPDDAKVRLSFEYMQRFAKGSKVGMQVCLSFKKDFPICLKYSIVDDRGAQQGSNNVIGHLSYYLAPKLDDEDEDDAMEMIATSGKQATDSGFFEQ
jgi:proliferating cell nuclear antigen PCNA